MSIDDEFFSSYKKEERVSGIPGIEMNAPLTSNVYTGTVGLELELEGQRLPGNGFMDGLKGASTGSCWNVKADGSLRNGGREYVLSHPCTVDEIKPLCDGLWKAFNDGGARIENSNRCSTHVHINLSGYKINQITSILCLWTTFEEALIEWCGELRKTNHFCLSTKDCMSTAEKWHEYLRSGKRPTENRGIKYSALNILPLWTFGSFEFRCGPAADSPEIPITWATFLHHFVKYAATRFTNPMDLSYALSERGGEEIFRDICEKAGMSGFANEVFLKTQNFDKSCMEGFRNIQNIVMGYPWDMWMDLINREYVPNPFGKKMKAKMPRPYRPMRGIEPDRNIVDDFDQANQRRAPMFNERGEFPRPFVLGDTQIAGFNREIYLWAGEEGGGWRSLDYLVDNAHIMPIPWNLVEQAERVR